MLPSRLALGAAFLAVLALLSWADLHCPRPGLALLPLALLAVVLGANELVRLCEHNAAVNAAGETPIGGRLSPSRYVVSTASAAATLISFGPVLCPPPAEPPGPAVSLLTGAGWVAVGWSAAVLIALVVELATYQRPGVATLRLAQSLVAITCVGAAMGFAAQLRLLSGGVWGGDGRWGMVALLSMVGVVKASDTGAFVAGKALGRTRMAPVLSPGKTWEGAAGGAALAIAASLLCLTLLPRALGLPGPDPGGGRLAGAVGYGLALAAAGVLGDLTISMFKRDSHLKNSSTWMPGFGGVLDVIDSLLLAAPVAYFFWVARVVGP